MRTHRRVVHASGQSRRRGAATVLMAAMLAVLVVMAGITINLGYIALLRTEHKVATDVASKAAAEALVRTESEEEAIAAAKHVASLHRVGSQPFDVSSSKIEFGHSTEQQNGEFDFVLGKTPLNAARVTSHIGSGLNGDPPAIAMLFGGMGHADYDSEVSSISTFIINDVVLCLDRSGSMKFDMSGESWTYPRYNPHVPLPYRDYLVNSTSSPGFWEHYYAPPHPSESRWVKLVNAIELFFAEADKAADPPQVGLVTWSSDHAADGTATDDYPLPSESVSWEDNQVEIRQALIARAAEDQTDGVFGGTLMAAGMQRGIEALQTSNSRTPANKVMILLTDGQYSGPDPYSVALDANDAGITIHCISLLEGSTFAMAQQISQATGGDAYMATNEAELSQAFIDIADSLNLVMTK